MSRARAQRRTTMLGSRSGITCSTHSRYSRSTKTRRDLSFSHLVNKVQTATCLSVPPSDEPDVANRVVYECFLGPTEQLASHRTTVDVSEISRLSDVQVGKKMLSLQGGSQIDGGKGNERKTVKRQVRSVWTRSIGRSVVCANELVLGCTRSKREAPGNANVPV